MRSWWRLVVFLSVVGCASVRCEAQMAPPTTEFRSGNGRFELRATSDYYAKPRTWNLFDLQTREVRYTIREDLVAPWWLVSGDGHSLVALDLDAGSWKDGGPKRALEFFVDGEMTLAYTLAQLLPDRSLVREMTDFYPVWTADMLPGLLPHTPPLVERAGTVSFTTIDLTVHEFEIRGGKSLRTRCDSRIPDGAEAFVGDWHLVTPAIESLTSRRFAGKGQGLCGTPSREVVFDVPKSFTTPSRWEWLTDEALLPNVDQRGAVIVRNGEIVGILDWY
jgi:hypothetical protein